MTTNKIHEALEVAHELSEHFPDLPNVEILDHVETVCEIDVCDTSVLAHALINAYDHGIDCGISTYRAYTGVLV